MTVDFAHTLTAAENRRAKATALADVAFAAGLQAFELAVVGPLATWGTAQRRKTVRTAAGLARDPSVETWQMVLGLLDARAACEPDTIACGVCGWPVRQVTTDQGTRLLVDPAPHPSGSVWLREDRLEAAVAVVLVGHAVDRPAEGEALYRPHARSCPMAKDAHARRRREAPRCRVCEQHLDRVLPLVDRSYTTHPTCDPREEVTRHG